MKLLAVLLCLFLASCGKDFGVKEHVEETNKGWECVQYNPGNHVALRVCETKEECSIYCDRVRRETVK